jgi:hypothetical protein
MAAGTKCHGQVDTEIEMTGRVTCYGSSTGRHHRPDEADNGQGPADDVSVTSVETVPIDS